MEVEKIYPLTTFFLSLPCLYFKMPTFTKNSFSSVKSLSYNNFTAIQEIQHQLLQRKSVKLFVKRDDLIHPQVSGNKWRKLKYNLLTAKKQKKVTLLTCLLYTSPSPRDRTRSRMPSSA